MTRPTAFNFIHFIERGLRTTWPAIDVEQFERLVDFKLHKASIRYRALESIATCRDFVLVCREITGESSGNFVFEARLDAQGDQPLEEDWLWFIPNETAFNEAANEVLNFIKNHLSGEPERPLLSENENAVAIDHPSEAVPEKDLALETKEPVAEKDVLEDQKGMSAPSTSSIEPNQEETTDSTEQEVGKPN